MMSYILHRGGDQRFVLQSAQTGSVAGLMLQPIPGEGRQSFAYDFGSTFDRRELLNVVDFPELDYLEFFTIEHLGFHDFDYYLNRPDWQPLRSLLLADAKAIGYNAYREKSIPNPLESLWHYTPPSHGLWKVPAWGLWVDDRGCWLSNRDGIVVALNHQGEISYQHSLPKAVRCLVGNDRAFYATCDDGQIYDLTGKLPRAVYNARSNGPMYGDFLIRSLALHNDHLLVLDAYGQLTCLTPDLQVQWQLQTDSWQGWFLQADDTAVYLGHSRGVSCYDLNTGKTVWRRSLAAPVLCGDVTTEQVIVGTSDGQVYSLSKTGDYKTQQPEIHLKATCEAAVYACTVVADRQLLIVADHQAKLYGFRLRAGFAPSLENSPENSLENIVQDSDWQHLLNCGAILTLRLWGDRLYGTTTDGTLVCFALKDLLTGSCIPIQPAQHIQQSTQYHIPASQSAAATFQLATETPDQGVLVECVRQGGKLKVRAISPGYDPGWNVQFPQNLRQVGVRYRVEALQEAKQGGFYRVVGKIQSCD